MKLRDSDMDEERHKQDMIEGTKKDAANVKLALLLGLIALVFYVGFLWFNLK